VILLRRIWSLFFGRAQGRLEEDDGYDRFMDDLQSVLPEWVLKHPSHFGAAIAPSDYVGLLLERITKLELQRSDFDCRYAGSVAEFSGSHCPVDKPCDRCAAEQRVAELKAELRKRIAELEAALGKRIQRCRCRIRSGSVTIHLCSECVSDLGLLGEETT
jgi:hypothetical protein